MRVHRLERLAIVALLGLACEEGTKAPAAALAEPAAEATPTRAPESADAPEPEATPDRPPPPDLPPPIDPNGDQLGAIEKGGSVAAVLRDAGLDAQARAQVLEALSAHTDPGKVQIGQRWIISREHDEVMRFALVLSKTERVVAQKNYDEDQHASWTAERVTLETEREQARYAGEIKGSLWASLERAGADPTLVNLFIDAFAYDLDFHTDSRAGDRFELLVDKEILDGEFVRYGRVHAAVYEGHAGRFELYWWPDPKAAKKDPDTDEGAYFDAEGKGIRKTFLKSPLKFSRVSSSFNPKRMHPVLHREKGHMGTDYAAPEGTPVWAAADGKIVFRGDKGGAGNMVILLHANGLKTLYMHLSAFEEGQKVGTRVEQKTVIGYVGMTGLATGPHLHFGVQKGGRYVDPEQVEVHRTADLPRSQRKAFGKRVEALQAAMAAPAPEGEPEPEPPEP